MGLLRSLALLTSPDLRDVGRRVAEADRLLFEAVAQVNDLTLARYDTSAEEKVVRARVLLNGVHRDIIGRDLPNRG